MFAALGMCFAAANDLIMMFVALRSSLCRCTCCVDVVASSAVVSGSRSEVLFAGRAVILFLYGIVLLYGCAGSLSL